MPVPAPSGGGKNRPAIFTGDKTIMELKTEGLALQALPF